MDLSFTTNQDFVLTLNVAPWAVIYPFPLCSFLMDMRIAATDIVPVYAWRSDPPTQWSGGTIAYDGGTQLMTVTAPYEDMLKLRAGAYVYDIQMNYDGFVKNLVGGQLIIYTGVSR